MPVSTVRRLGQFLRPLADPSTNSDSIWTRVFWAWLALRTVIWTVFVTLTLANPPLDLVEWLSWGHSLEWGYPKHPPLPAWLAVAFARLSPGDVWGVYLLAYLITAACIWVSWRLAREYLPAPQAFAAALCLEGSLYFTNDPAEWSNNVALNLGWAFVILCAHRAIHTNSLRWWVGLGFATGLTLLCKYTVGVLLLPLAAYMIFNSNARRCWRGPGPYVAALLAALVFAPHLIWLARNEFITVTYAGNRAGDDRTWPHIRNPIEFVLGQAYRVLPMFLVLYPAMFRRSGTPTAGKETAPGVGYLHTVVLGPLAILFTLSITTGCLLREIWGSPLWTFFGVWVLAIFPRESGMLSPQRILGRVLILTAIMLPLSVVLVELRPFTAELPSRQQFPGKALSAEINRRWAEQYPQPFPIVAGEAWAAGNVCCFSTHRPILYSSGIMGFLVFESRTTPWTSDDDLNTRGGVVLWDATLYGDAMPPDLRSRLPRAVGQPPVVLPHHTYTELPPARIGVAFIPPKSP